MQNALSNLLKDSYIICSCEGIAEKAIIDLLLDNNQLCFSREDLIHGECTTCRKGSDIAQEFLTQDYGRSIAILRIIDREKDKFVIPQIYKMNRNIAIFDIVTKPEIEILHIITEGLDKEYKRARNNQKSNLKPSSFCKGILPKKYPSIRSVKSEDCIQYLYGDDIFKLITTIEKYHSNVQHKTYCLYDLLIHK